MAITVYTYNDKVLKNVATDKWLKKPDAPAGFVMDASNVASMSGPYASWQGPNYPDSYDGNGKTLVLTVKADIGVAGWALMYTRENETAGPYAMQFTAAESAPYITSAGTYEFTMNANSAAASNYGSYLTLYIQGPTSNISEIISNIELTILD